MNTVDMHPGRKYRHTLIVVSLVLIVVITFAVAFGYRGSEYRTSDVKECQQQCAGQGTNGRLVPLLTIRPNKPGSYNGPWRCECRIDECEKGAGSERKQ